jgi:hypothetical protein
MRDARLLRRLPNPASALIHNYVVMRCISAQQTSDADDRVILSRFRESTGGGRNFERTRNASQVYILFLDARTQKPVIRALKQPLRDERIEAGYYDGKALACATQIPFDSSNRRLRRSFYLYSTSILLPDLPLPPVSALNKKVVSR